MEGGIGFKHFSPIVVAFIVVIFAASTNHVTSFPVILSGQANSVNIGQKVHVSSNVELHSLMNHTVPDVLTASLNPYEYLKQHGHNVTGLDILSFVMPNHNSRYGQRVRRSSAVKKSNPSCPVMWVVNMEADRDPVRIDKAVCNGQGTTCLSNGKPSCEEFSVTYEILRFLGMDSEGKQIWQKQYQTIPIACTCSAQ